MLKKSNLIFLFSIIIPLLIIGASNYLFASSSYHFVIDPYTMERTGRYWVGDFDGVFMALALCIVVTAVWIPACSFKWTDKFIESLNNRIIFYRRYIKENRNKLIIKICIGLIIILAAIVFNWVYSFFSPVRLLYSLSRTLFFITVGFSIYIIILFRCKPDKLFLFLSLIIGFMYVSIHPTLFFGFDCEMHYAWAVEESFLLNVSIVESDLILANSFQHSFFGMLPSGEQNAVVFSFPKGTDTLAWTGAEELRMWYTKIVHVFMGLAIYFSRSIALHPNIILMTVMLSSHLVYTLIVYHSIKRLESGKYLIAAIAMLPTTFIISAGLGYDDWLTAFIILGFAYCFYEIQKPDKKIQIKSLIIMIGAFFLGLSAKPVYFPVLLILYCIRRDKFKTVKGHRWYIIAVTCFIVFVVLSFAMPFILSLLGGSEGGDYRGGEGVNAMEQVLFILQNPLAYTVILLRFLRDYFNVFESGWFISYYGSYWHASFPNLLWLVILFITLTDRCEEDRLSSTVKQKALMMFIIFSTVAIFSTAMYVGFTEVGAESIAGVQKRYLISLLFPFLYVVGGFKIGNNINKAAYSCFVFGFMSLVLLSGAWNTFIP